MKCPKCGLTARRNAAICRGCDFILDATFLRDDIRDDEKDLRHAGSPDLAPNLPFEDAIILGDDSGELETVAVSFSGALPRQLLYVGGVAQALLRPGAIPLVSDAVTIQTSALNPYEAHLLAFVDGRTPLAGLQTRSGLPMAEVKAALASLAEKGVLRLATSASPPPPARDPDPSTLRLPTVTMRQPVKLGEAKKPAPSKSGPAQRHEVPGRDDDETLALPPVLAPPGSAGRHVASREQKARAARMFALAEKDRTARRLDAACMNARLAMIYDPSEKRYARAFEAWSKERDAQVASKASKLPREAQEAELEGDYPRAVHLLERALIREPDAPDLLNRLGVLLATRLRDNTRALLHLRRAVELAPERPSYQSNLAKVLSWQRQPQAPRSAPAKATTQKNRRVRAGKAG